MKILLSRSGLPDIDLRIILDILKNFELARVFNTVCSLRKKEIRYYQWIGKFLAKENIRYFRFIKREVESIAAMVPNRMSRG